MKKISFKFLYPLLTLVLLTIVMNRKVFMAPPVGLLLNPFKGFVQNEKSSDNDLNLNCGRAGLIEIHFDERAIPHVFADNQKDLFFAQGYVTASNRLWQMDFLSYVAAGRLSEIFGEDFLEYDRNQRRLGIMYSAINSLKFIEANQETRQALDNYTEGVNSYINHISETDLPAEYKLLDYRPEQWTNLKSVLIMKYMSALLSGYEEDASSSYLLAALGKKEYDKLFSNFLINETEPRFTIDLIRDTLSSNSYINFSFLESSPQISSSPFNPRLGSNSWAVGPEKSASGFAILCNDPHLNLSLPAIWYELQLHSKEMNVYGFTIPGTPGVIIGYNQNISWGLTNGSADVRNLFKLELKEDYSQYKYDGHWRNTGQTIVEIKIRNAKSIFDTIYSTIHGPIASDFRFGPKEKQGLATQWTLFNPSNEFLSFIKLNKASNYEEFKDAIKYYKCPAQNFTYADVNGNIATHFQGEILKNHWNGQGKFILDGTKLDHLSTEILTNELPFVSNPIQGFVYSANNNPFYKTNSLSVYGHYSELRANKIKQDLSREKKFTVEDMKLMQLDNTNRLAELSLPLLLNFILADSSEYKKKFLEWDCKYTREAELAIVFEQWWDRIKNNTWDELFRFKKVRKLPNDLILLDMISNDPNNKYFDVLSTDKIETAGDIIRLSLKEGTQNVHKPMIKWGNCNKVDIMHLTNIPAFSKLGIQSSGHPNAINAVSRNWGPSLRFIVEMDKKPQGYAVYAGGQSGNLASKEYDRFVDDWTRGKYYKLNFFLNKQEAKSKTNYKWTIK
jgi:penicillin G amidase